MSLDTDLVLFIHQFTGNYWIDSFFIFVTYIGIPILIAILILTKDKKNFLSGVLSVLIAYGGYFFIHLFWNRARPFVTIPSLHAITVHSLNASFPSGHSLFSFAVATTIWYTKHPAWLKITALFIAALVAFSRVYVGVHYVSDVIVGSFLGSGAGLVVQWFRKNTK